jgi:hypothetical protein
MAVNQQPQLPSAISRFQGPLQAAIRPAAWIPGFRNIRYHSERWGCSNSVGEVFGKLSELAREYSVARSLMDAYVVVHKEDHESHFLALHTYTPVAEWLDVVEIKVTGYRGSEGCAVNITSFSSGFLPTTVPLAPLLNIAFFWVPFSGRDNQGWTNSRRVHAIRKDLAAKGITIAN